VIGDVPIAAAGSELATGRTPEIAFIAVYRTAEFGGGGSSGGWNRLGNTADKNIPWTINYITQCLHS